MAGSGPGVRLEVADVLRRHGDAYRLAHAGHLGRVERRVMSAIVACRTAALGGHIEACDDCGVARVAYNSCRNRHCPKCQGVARAQWLAARQAELLAVPYFHVVFTLPAPIAAIAFQNKAVVYAILFAASAEAMTTLAANPRRLGAQIGVVAVLHTWGQTLTHHPHVHCVVPGGGLSPDGTRWVAGRPNFFLAVKPLAKLFRRLFLERLQKAFDVGALRFFGDLVHLAEPLSFHALAAHMRRAAWVVYAKKPFGGPAQVLAYLGRYTHRVAIANSRIQDCDDDHVAFAWKDYRDGGAVKTMCLKPDEFIRRFLLHALPDGFHRIRHFGFLANGHRTQKLALCRSLLTDGGEPTPRGKIESPTSAPSETVDLDPPPCPECGGVMRIIADLPRGGQRPRSKRSPFWCDTS
ncbi:MAG: IS91 family transposase [Roseiarcus sp.]